MTVDTQLWAQGMPVLGNGFGLWINADTDDDTSDLVPGAAEIAWRMTASTLKNTIKDMYQGELIVMGDPSVKPYDRILLTDIYQEMQGAAWVEAVVHSFNAQTGYTTSIFADCINEIDDRYEQQNDMLARSACATAAAAYLTPVIFNQVIFRKNMKYVNSFLMDKIVKGGFKVADILDENRLPLTNLLGIIKITNVDEAQKDIITAAIKAANALEGPLDGVGTAFKNERGVRNRIVAATKALFTRQAPALVSTLLNPFDGLGKTLKPITEIKNASQLASLLSKNAKALEDVTGTNLAEKLKIISDSDDIQEIAKALAKYDDVLNKEIASTFGSIINEKLASNLTDLAYSIVVSDMDDTIIETAYLLQNYAEGKTLIDSAESLKDFADLLQDCANVSKDTTLLKTIGSSIDDIKKFDNIADVAKDVYKYAPDLKDIVKGFGALTGPAGIIGTLAWMVIEMAISATIGAYATEKLERYLQNLQVMHIYPLSKNGKVMTAGITGHKGLVVGSPTENMQGAWTTFVTDLFGAKKPDSFVTGAIQMFFASDKAREIASRYRSKNNLPDVVDTSYDLADLQAKFDANFNKRVSILAQKNPMLNLNLNRFDDIQKSSPYFKEYMATSYENGIGLSEDTRREFIPIKSYSVIKGYIDNKLLVLLHDLVPNGGVIEAPFNGETVKMSTYLEDDKKQNVPMLRQDALIILNLLIGKYIEAAQITTGLLEEDKIQTNQLQLTSATILDSETYEGTGLVFRITSQNLKALETACANLTREINDNKFMVNHFESSSEQIIAIAIPKPEVEVATEPGIGLAPDK